jgi:hypothetical protein
MLMFLFARLRRLQPRSATYRCRSLIKPSELDSFNEVMLEKHVQSQPEMAATVSQFGETAQGGEI